MSIRDFIGLVQVIKKINNNNKDFWRQQMFAHRWKYFFTVWIYLAVCVAFIILGFVIKDRFFTIIHWYIWEGLSFIFLALGIYTMISYLLMIIRGK